MLTRPYGSTGIEVSLLGFGGMRFPASADADSCAALVRAAHDAGITYFDTAIGYGRSEEVMGLAFREMMKTRRAKPFFVASKTSAGDPDQIRRDCETSLKRLQVDAIDFYHVWCVLGPDAWSRRKAEGVLDGFERLKREGLVRNICVSTHMQGVEIGPMLNDYPFAGVLLGYSAMNFAYRERGVQTAADLKRGVVVMNPLGGGIIPQHPERFAHLRTRPDETVVEGALRFLFDDPRLSVVLVGIADQAQLDAALRAVEGYRPLSAETRARLRAEALATSNELCTGCAYCEGCPVDLPIPKLMDAYNQQVLGGSAKDVRNRLKWHWNLMDPKQAPLADCIACGACESACTQHLPIIERIRAVRAAMAETA